MVGRRRRRQRGGTVPIALLVAWSETIGRRSHQTEKTYYGCDESWTFWLRNYRLADRGKRNAPGGYKNTTFQARQIIIAQK